MIKLFPSSSPYKPVKYQLLKYRPDLNIVPIRGNVDTRIKKIVDETILSKLTFCIKSPLVFIILVSKREIESIY